MNAAYLRLYRPSRRRSALDQAPRRAAPTPRRGAGALVAEGCHNRALNFTFLKPSRLIVLRPFGL